MADALLVEWEGVLADTRTARRDALALALADQGLDVAPLADDELSPRELAGDAIARAGITDPVIVDLVAMRASRHFASALTAGLTLDANAVRAVERLRMHAPVAVVTEASAEETALFLNLAGLDGLVNTVVASDADPASPSSGQFALAVRRLSRQRTVRAGRSIALAQRSAMLRSARDAGLRTVAVHSPAHVAMHADGALRDLDALTPSALDALAGLGVEERRT